MRTWNGLRRLRHLLLNAFSNANPTALGAPTNVPNACPPAFVAKPFGAFPLSTAAMDTTTDRATTFDTTCCAITIAAEPPASTSLADGGTRTALAVVGVAGVVGDGMSAGDL